MTRSAVCSLARVDSPEQPGQALRSGEDEDATVSWYRARKQHESALGGQRCVDDGQPTTEVEATRPTVQPSHVAKLAETTCKSQ